MSKQLKMKRERAINWDKDEKHLLLEIIKEYIQIIENKDLSTNTSKEKSRAWNEILNKFNALNSTIRDIKQLKNQWKSSKLSSKKEISSYRREITRTGGGPKPSSPSAEATAILQMIPPEFEIDENEFDSDGIKGIPYVATPMISVALEEMSDTEIADCEIINTNGTDEAFRIVTPNPPKPPKPPKRPGKKTKEIHETFNFSEKTYNDMHQFRLKENDRLQKEHEKRMENMEEIHGQMMRNLILQQDILLKTLENLNN